MRNPLTVQEIKDYLSHYDQEDDFITSLSSDPRKTVQKLLNQWHLRQEKQRQLCSDYQKKSVYEQFHQDQGASVIVGVDEVGRGPLAGPVVAAAVCLDQNHPILGLDDSKKISAKKREALFLKICKWSKGIGIGIIDAYQIDRLNIYKATQEAMLVAVDNLSFDMNIDVLLVDAMTLPTDIDQQSIIKGDQKSVSIAAASIVAKVVRDNLMKQYHECYPVYGFDRHMGYGTKEHLAQLYRYGICPIHRTSFAPIKNM